MNTGKLRTYRFETKAQWDACMFVRADRGALPASDAVRPFAPFGLPPTRYGSDGARNPVVTRAGEIMWLDDNGVLHRLSPCNETPDASTSPCAIARASRIVATSDGLWMMTGDPPDSLELYETDSFTRLRTIDVSGRGLIDITSDGRKSIFALVKDNGVWKAVSFHDSGHISGSIEFPGLSKPVAFTFLKDSQTFVILTAGSYPKLQWFAVKRGSDPSNSEKLESQKKNHQVEAVATLLFSRVVASMRPCFTANMLGSDGGKRAFLAGRDGDEFGGSEYILTFDTEGNSLGDVPVDPGDSPVTGITGNQDSLLATGRRGLLRFRASDVVPNGAAPISCSLITPMLFSPDREDKRRWLRVEASARLPEGTTLEIAYATADTNDEKKFIQSMLNDTSVPPSHRAEKFISELDLWKGTTVFRGSGLATQESQTVSAKLFDEHDRYVWVRIAMSAATGAHLPTLSRLDVLYPGRTLMENLPAIYQTVETEPDSFLRALVGVLETSTHGIDERIASMGSLINPASAPERWLDFIARWVGVPWDDALGLEQKRGLLARAADIAKGRGTRAGLEAMLGGLIPGPRRRFRVTDATADFGFAVVGGESCDGSSLPAMLGGRTRWSTELDWTTVLGRMRLPCKGQLDDGVWQLAGNVRIDIAATAAERKAWEPWLLALIEEMVPFTARVEVHWVTERSLRTNRLDGTTTLEPPPTPHLGTDAITNLARLPKRRVRLSDCDPIVGGRL